MDGALLLVSLCFYFVNIKEILILEMREKWPIKVTENKELYYEKFN